MTQRDYPDHTRVLRLLWRGAEEPSPRSGLTVGSIVDTAIAIADSDGLAAVTMRRVAEALGVGAMSLYTYLPGREELVILMSDQVYNELPAEDVVGDWRARVEALARSLRDLLRRHLWLLDVPLTRPAVGPHIADRYEYSLRTVDGVGLDDLEMDAALEMINRHVAGTVDNERAIARDAARSGMSDDEWWYSVLPVFAQVMADRHYPLSARVGSAIGAPHSDVDLDFEFGLARILDGLEHLIAERDTA